jgi:hypothetical protein
MRVYLFLFASCFTFLKRVETSITAANDENRALRVALFFALAQVFNLYAIKPKQDPRLSFVPFSIFALLNCILFVPNNRYLKYVAAYRNHPYKNVYGAVTILYFVGTMIFYYYTNAS